MTRRSGFSSESEFVEKLFAPLSAGFPGAFGLQDDAAVIAPESGHELVVTTDTIVAGVHFLCRGVPGEARAVARKALGVNVSDLVAKGAEPRAYLLALTLPDTIGAEWLEQFAAGLAACQALWSLSLIGGDTTRGAGPLTLTITAIGSVPVGRIVRREGARPGDRIFVSGTIGDGGIGLKLARADASVSGWPARIGDTACRDLIRRYEEPEPRLALIPALRQHASAALDISDGLMLDLRRLCRSSGVGARIALASLPVGPAARALVQAGEAALPELATSGDDYEVLCTVSPQQSEPFQAAVTEAGAYVTLVGEITDASKGIAAIDAGGAAVNFAREGWDHISG